MNDWRVELEGVALNGCDSDSDGLGTLSFPPEGLGLPGLRVEDEDYLQRDGTRHFNDWYEPRIINLVDVTVCPDDCAECTSARARVRDLLNAWGRKCDDIELVIWPPCEAPETRVNYAPTPRPNPEWDPVGPNPQDTWQFIGSPTVTYVPAIVPGEPDATTAIRIANQGFGILQATQTFSEGVTISLWARSGGAATVAGIYVTGGSSDIIFQATGTWGAWTRFSGTHTGPVDTGVYIQALPPAGGWLEITGVLIEDALTVGTYFDGATPDSGDSIYSWNGSPFTSASTEGPDRTLYGPFGIVGRPRRAEVVWERGASGCATLQFRFDAVDHRIYVLDPDGTPGSGTRCVTLTPAVAAVCRSYPRCYGEPQPPVLLRTNLAVTPRPNPEWTTFPDAADTWQDAGGGAAPVYWTVNDHPIGLTKAVRAPEGLQLTALSGPIAINGGLTVSIWVQSLGDVSMNCLVDGAPVSWDASPAGAWTRMTHTFTTGTSMEYLEIWGNDITVTGLLIEQAPAVADYFDGATPDAGGYTYNWTGTQFSSASQMWQLTPSEMISWCYDQDGGDPGAGPVPFNVRSTICVRPVITLYGLLTNPIIENLTTGDSVGYNGTISADDPPVIIDLEAGTATQGGASRNHLITGNPQMLMTPGVNTLRLSSFGSTDSGYAEVCWRDQVVTA